MPINFKKTFSAAQLHRSQTAGCWREGGHRGNRGIAQITLTEPLHAPSSVPHSLHTLSHFLMTTLGIGVNNNHNINYHLLSASVLWRMNQALYLYYFICSFQNLTKLLWLSSSLFSGGANYSLVRLICLKVMVTETGIKPGSLCARPMLSSAVLEHHSACHFYLL